VTAPVASDYPDWGRYQAQSAKIYATIANPAVNADFTTNVGYVGDVPHLGTFIEAAAGAIVVEIAFFADAAGALLLANHTMSLRAGDRFFRTVPVLGPFCRVNWFVAAAPVDLTASFSQSTAPFSAFTFNSSANVLASDFGATAFAPGNTNVEANRVWPGEANLYAEIPAGGGYVAVFSVSAAGTETFLTRVSGAGITGDRRLYLPATHIRIRVNNGAGVAALFVFALTAQVFG
jgi:hypothetical protein